jgi:hypothetical protein
MVVKAKDSSRLRELSFISSGRSISRILSDTGRTLHLGDHLSGRHVAIPLDAAYPGLAPSRWRVHMWRRAASRRPQTASSLLGLAPSGGYLATHITARAGGLLHHRFTLAPLASPPLIGGGWEGVRFVSVALSGRFTPLGGFPAPGALRRRALWSADFPRPRQRRAAIARPT